MLRFSREFSLLLDSHANPGNSAKVTGLFGQDAPVSGTASKSIKNISPFFAELVASEITRKGRSFAFYESTWRLRKNRIAGAKLTE